MAEGILITKHTKKDTYEELIPQLAALTQGEKNTIANAANVAAALKQVFDFFWVGFYFVEGSELVLGPFQGPIACTRISFGKGVCGFAWEKKETILVPNVELFPGHIACSGLSKSEIVVPKLDLQTGEVKYVLDVDSDQLDGFDEIDKIYLEKIVSFV